MSEFDESLDAEGDVADFVLAQLLKLVEFPGNEFNFPGPVQAAQAFVDLVVGTTGPAYVCHEEFPDFAIWLAEVVERRQWAGSWWLAEWAKLPVALRAWAAEAEECLNPPESPRVRSPARPRSRRR